MAEAQARVHSLNGVLPRSPETRAPVSPGPLVKRMQMLVGLSALKSCPACAADVHRCDVVEGDVFTHCCEVVFDCGATVRLMRDARLEVIDGCKQTVATALQHFIPGVEAHAAR